MAFSHIRYKRIVTDKLFGKKIKVWLKKIDKNRFWLGLQLGVAPGTVNNYLKGNINLKTRMLIESLMQATEGNELDHQIRRALELQSLTSISCPVTAEEKNMIQESAEADGLSIEEYMRKIMLG